MITTVEHPEGTKLVPFEGGWKVETILEKNKWYKNKEYGNLVFYHSNKEDNYGFSFHQKLWSNNLHFVLDNTWLPSSEEEVKEALIAEAKRRGYKEGIHISWGKRKGIIKSDFYWATGSDCLSVRVNLTSKKDENPNLPIMLNGKWAEILSNTNEKILEKNSNNRKGVGTIKSRVEMILRKDYVKLIQEGKAQVEVEKTEEHNEMLNLIFPKRDKDQEVMIRGFYKVSGCEEEYTCCGDSFHNLPTIHASDIILDNTVIKVESEEHGKRVIEWWRNQGVDTTGFDGSDFGGYYGTIDSLFGNWTGFNIKGRKIITLPETFPSKWYLKVNDSNKEVANEWRLYMNQAPDFKSKTIDEGHLLMSYHPDGSYYYNNTEQRLQIDFPDYTKLTTDQFLEKVYKPFKAKQKQENKMRIITWQAGQSIIDIACVDWKGKLFDIWARPIVMKEPIEIKDSFYKEMRKACTKEQHELFDRIFGKEKEEINLERETGINGLKLFKKKGDIYSSLISVNNHEIHGGNSFCLNTCFDWEIKKTNQGELWLIPTHK